MSTLLETAATSWNRDFFVLSLASSYGRQTSEAIIDRMLLAARLPNRASYERDEAVRICEAMAGAPEMFLQTIAVCLQTRICFPK